MAEARQKTLSNLQLIPLSKEACELCTSPKGSQLRPNSVESHKVQVLGKMQTLLSSSFF